LKTYITSLYHFVKKINDYQIHFASDMIHNIGVSNLYYIMEIYEGNLENIDFDLLYEYIVDIKGNAKIQFEM
jgi:hypothetical protein